MNTVKLHDGTIGTIDVIIPSEAFMKEGVFALLSTHVTVNLHDENGQPITKTGVIVEVLE